MKSLINVIRITVGILFIISGFIKLNDPVGFSFKLQEYFSPAVLDLEFLSPFSLGLAIVLVVVELVLGIALIIGYLKKTTLALLLLMIVFFTFLTFYSAYYHKVTDCGCFGDALPLTPWQSFGKDVVLLVLILILIFGQKHIKPFFSNFGRSLIIFLVFMGSLGFGYYVLMHLPYFDFRPYKEGANIAEGMGVPENAPKAIFDYHWVFEVGGQEKTITTRGIYPESDGKFLRVDTETVQAGYLPPIHDFTIEKDGEDYTAAFLNTENLLVIVAYNINKTEWNGWPKVKELTDRALKNGYEVIGLTASGAVAINDLTEKQKVNFEFYKTDETALKTIIRSNPGILKLQKGTIIQKRHFNDAEDIDLIELPTARAELNLDLKRKLDTIARLDTLYRSLIRIAPEEREDLAQKMGLHTADYMGDLQEKQRLLDMGNLELIKNLLDKGKYPGIDQVGTPTNLVALDVVKHNPEYIPQYLDLFKAAAKRGQLPFTLVATMEDKYLMGKNEEQLYGTQAQITASNGMFIWPIKDATQVNARRKEAGFKLTIEDYAKELIGENFTYEAIALADVQKL